MSNQHTRFAGGGDGTIGQQRYQLYKAAWEQINRAVEQGFYIEAVAIIDSIMSDRLDARYQFLIRDTDKSIKPVTTDTCARRIIDSNVEMESELLPVYPEIRDWVIQRNQVIHHFVTVTTENIDKDVKEREIRSKETVDQGLDLVRKLSNLVKKYNKYE